MIKLNEIYQWSFYVVVLFTFFIGGALQFFLNVSNTILTLLLALFMLANYFLYIMVKRSIKINTVIILFLLYIFIIILSGIINGSNVIKIGVYLIFAILPLSVYLFFSINKNEGYVSQRTIYKIILSISLIQLPIILIQKHFYSYIMLLKNTSQKIASVDFLFGSFLLKSDHSLGCFLLLTIISLVFNLFSISRFIPYRYPIALYLSLTLFMSESTITKLLLFTVWALFIFLEIRKVFAKSVLFKRIFIGLSVLLIAFSFYNLRNIEFITSRVGGTVDNHFSPEKSLEFYENGTAKREQIVVAAVTKLKPKIIGAGPYSYFDIIKGEFSKTGHFSQIIWTYFDLGLFGLIITFFIVFCLIKSTLKYNIKLLLFILPIVIVYMFYTNVFSEIGIIVSLFLIFNIKPKKWTY